jgi:hypothetical protein
MMQKDVVDWDHANAEEAFKKEGRGRKKWEQQCGGRK